MALRVTCGADVLLRYLITGGHRSVPLSANAAGGVPTVWTWTVLSVPIGSGVLTGAWGDFTDGVAHIQNPTLDIDDEIDGTFVCQCVASNAAGSSSPAVDEELCQQCVVVRGEGDIALPGDGAYEWGDPVIVPALRRIAKNFGGMHRKTWDLPDNLHFVDGVAGDDDNDGLSWATAKQTLDAWWTDIVPAHVNEVYDVEFRDADDTGKLLGFLSGKTINAAGSIVIHGEAGYTDTSGNIAITSTPTKSVVEKLGAGWVPDAYAGLQIRFTSGANLDQVRGVLKNDATDLTLSCALENLGAPADTFVFCEPKGNYTGNLGVSILAQEGKDYSRGVRIGHFNLLGGGTSVTYSGPGWITFQNIMGGGGGGGRTLAVVGAGNGPAGTYVDISHPTGLDRSGCMLNGSWIVVTGARINYIVDFLASYVRLSESILVGSIGGAAVGNGSRVLNGDAHLLKCHSVASAPLRFLEVEVGGTQDYGILISNCSCLVLGQSVSASNALQDGVHVHNSNVIVIDVLSGAGNVGWGMSLRHGSHGRIAAGVTPTITGGAGQDARVGAGPADADTWVNIMAGAPIFDAVEMSYVASDDDAADG